MSTKLTTWVLAGAVMVCHYGSLMAESRTGEPAAAMVCSFDGATSATGWFGDWDGEKPGASNYITTPHGQGFTIYYNSDTDKAHPYKDKDIGASFSLALYADISAVEASEATKRLLMVAGTASANHVALLKTAANTVAVYQGQEQLGELTFTSEALASGYHLFVFGGNSTGSFLAVDGVKVASNTPVNDPAAGLQVGSVYFGFLNKWTGVDKAIGMEVDEVRGYDRVLSDAEIAQLSGSLTFYARTAVPVRANSTVALALTTAELASGQVTFTSPNATEPTGVTWKLSHAGSALSVTPTATFVAAEDGQSGTWTVRFTANTAYEAITLDVSGAGIPAAAKTAQPTGATAFGKSSDYLAISADGTYWQAVKVTDATNSPMLFGGLGFEENGPINRNLLLTVTGGDFSHIYGGNNADQWGTDRTRNINGNTRVEMSGGTVNYLLGGNYKDGAATPVTLGNIDVVVSGKAVVKGSIFGGSVSAHIMGTTVGSATQPQQVTVKVKNLQAKTSAASADALTPGYIAGGDTYMSNTSPTCTIYGDTAVVIDLPAEATGTFVKSLVGGSALLAGGEHRSNPALTVTGNSSVTIIAPKNVTFSQTVVMGGPAFGGTTGSVTTGGNASVTIRGGKYTGTIYAGGSGARATVSGNATLTLESGDFSEATIAPCGPGSTVGGTSTLAIDGNVDLSSTTISPFSTMTLAAGKTLKLGTNRLTGMPLTSGANAGWATLAVTLTAAEVTAGYAELCGYRSETLPAVSVTLPNGADASVWSATVIADKLVLSTGVKPLTWTNDAANWSEGLTGFNPGDDVTFDTTIGSEAEGVAVPSGIAVGEMTVNGAYTFSLADFGAGFSASKITVSGSGKATFETKAVRYVRLQLDNVNGGTGDNAVPGVSELILTRDGEAVAWPLGTTIKQVNLNGTTVEPTWADGGNEKVNALIDGVWSGSENGRTYTNPNDGSTGTYTDQVVYNKWWPCGNPKAYAVIKLGATIDFDGYKLMTTDHKPRSAKNWTLEVSADGETWFVADSRANRLVPDSNSFYVYEPGNTIFPVVATVINAPIEVESNGTLGGTAKITGDVTFADGAVLDVTAGAPTVTGDVTASGTVTVVLPEGTVLQPVLTTATPGLESRFSRSGYEFLYREGTYWAVRTAAKTLMAEVTEAEALSNLAWLDTDRTAVAREEVLKLWAFGLEDATATLNTTTAAAVTIDCPAVPALTLSGSAAVTLSAATGVTPTIASLTVSADSTVAAALLNRVTGSTTVERDNTLSLTGDGTIGSVISGAGALRIASGTTTLSQINTYTGGTTIETGATVVLGNANALGTEADITGSGTIKSGAFVPTCDLTNPSWTGTFEFASISGTAAQKMNWEKLGKRGSKVVIPANVTITGYFHNSNWELAADVELNGTIELTDGYSNYSYTFSGPLTGSGTFKMSATTGANFAVLLRDVDDFTGTLSIPSTSSQNKAFIVGGTRTFNSETDKGKIIIAGEVTTDAVRTWTAKNGIVVEGTLTTTLTETEATNGYTLSGVTVVTGGKVRFVRPDKWVVEEALNVYDPATAVFADATWTGSGDDTNWATVGNWACNGQTVTAAPGTRLASLTVAAEKTITLPGAVTVGSLTTLGDFTLAGATDTSLTAKVVTLGGAVTLNAPLVLDLASALETNKAITVNASGALTTKGTVSLTNADCTFAGPLTVESGSLTWRHDGGHTEITGNITVNSGATFATVANYKYNTTLKGALSGAGTIRAKVPTIRNQDDGTRYLKCNGNCDGFTGTLMEEVSITKENHSAPRRTNVVLKPADGKFGGSLAVQLVTVSSANDTTLSTDAAVDAEVADGVLDYAKAYITGNAEIRGTVDKNLTLVIGTTESGSPSASATTLTGTLGTITGEREAAKSTFSAPITVASGSTLTLNNAVATTLAGALSGSGAITLGGAGVVNVTAANGGYTGQVTINSGATLTNKDHGEPIPFGKGSIVNNGTLKLIAGTKVAVYGCALLPPTSGTGDIVFCSGSETRLPAPITTSGKITFEGTAGETAAAVVTFVTSTADYFFEQVASIKGASVVVGEGVTLAKDGDFTPRITIDAEKSLSGSGTINVPVAFENEITATMASGASLTFGSTLAVPKNVTLPGTVTLASTAVISGAGTLSGAVTFETGAVLDTVTAAPLRLNGTVTGKIKVKLPSGITTAKEILVTDPSVKLDRVKQLAFADDLTSQQYKDDNFCFVESVFKSQHTFTVSAPLTLTSLSDSVTDSEVARNAIYAAVEAIRDTSSVTTIKEIDARSTNNEVLTTSSADALALFENLSAWAEPITGDGAVAGEGKVVVMYDFGISQLHVKRAALNGEESAPLYVLLCAKVASVDTVPADYASGTIVSLYRGNAALNDAVKPTDEQLTALGLTRGAGEKWFAVPMSTLGTGTHAFKVKASQTTQEEVTP